jgi:uncharacterized membrane protein
MAAPQIVPARPAAPRVRRTLVETGLQANELGEEYARSILHGVTMNDTGSGAETNGHLDIRDLMQRAWTAFRTQPVAHILGFLIVAVGGALTLGLAAAPLLVGYLRMVDRAAAGEEVRLQEVLDGLASFGPAFLVGLILAAGVAIASAVVVLPGLVVGFVLGWALWYIALERRGPIESLQASWYLVRGNAGSLLLLALATIAINFVGLLVVIGWVVTMPFALIMATLAFRDLTR